MRKNKYIKLTESEFKEVLKACEHTVSEMGLSGHELNNAVFELKNKPIKKTK